METGPPPREPAPSKRPPGRGPRSESVRAALAQRAQTRLRTRAPPRPDPPDRRRARGYPPIIEGCGSDAPRIGSIRARHPRRHTSATNFNARRTRTEAQTRNRENRIVSKSPPLPHVKISGRSAKKRGSDHNSIPRLTRGARFSLKCASVCVWEAAWHFWGEKRSLRAVLQVFRFRVA